MQDGSEEKVVVAAGKRTAAGDNKQPQIAERQHLLHYVRFDGCPQGQALKSSEQIKEPNSPVRS